MCRITGFWDFNYTNDYPLKETISTMRDTMKHGGPDSGGRYIDANHALALGHRRLSIVDLSAAGDQPMYWDNYALIFNGEIYNYKEIRKELQSFGYTFSSDTDTEVLIKAFKQWGIDMIEHFRGMFIFVIWDIAAQKMIIGRDRVGVKPLFWYQKDGLFMFSSELKAFHQHPHFDKKISQAAVSLYLQQGYIQYPYCIFAHAHKLAAGAYLEIDCQQKVKITKYWDVQKVYEETPISKKKEPALLEEMEAVLTESFELRMVADVPVGAFLSGGIDSSLVTALLQKKKGRQLKTFTIGFEDKEYNEAGYAKEVAKHLGTDHHEFYCTEKDFESVIPLLPELYDEPFGDSSAIPTYLVSKMAKEHVKVSLSADGGDEIFGGYTKYEITQKFYPKIKKMPSFLRGGLAGIAGKIDPLWLERNSSKFPILKNYKNISNKFPKLRNALSAKNTLDFFNISSTYISPKDQQKLYAHYQARYQSTTAIKDKSLISYLGMVDIETYLEGDIMTKVDRATMGVALEGREPFLDHKIIEFAMQLPDDLKIKGNETKYLLRKLLFKYVPRELIERPKQGFSIPVQKWLLDLLKENLLALREDRGFIAAFQFNPKELENIIDNFLKQDKYQNPHFIWFLYCLHQWYLRWFL